MKSQPISDSDWTIHSLNIHGIFFERWCQRVVSDSAGWSLVASSYPVEFPPPNGPIRGRESSLDVRADREFGGTKLSLIIECKKNNPDLSNWVFFPRPVPDNDWFNVSVNEIVPAALPATTWDVTSGVHVIGADAALADEARETRGDYLQTKANNKTKTSNAAISEAAFQVALAKQAIVLEEVKFQKALGASAPAPNAGPHHHLFLPMIVTTANLFTCEFDPIDVDAQSGEIPLGKAELVPCSRVVYEYGIPKQLQSTPSDLAGTLSSGRLDRFTRMHIMVLHSSDFAAFLSTYFQ